MNNYSPANIIIFFYLLLFFVFFSIIAHLPSLYLKIILIGQRFVDELLHLRAFLVAIMLMIQPTNNIKTA